ncbi:hypothetical protein CSA37_11765 [Candidatus Fermentibacteria bacterium]|nr:MAG: hypothetical protein CSA37_11765 [Candidatus Fermentibacteria bacterium]
MFVKVSTHFCCTEEELWKEITKQESLRFVASPVLTFVPLNRKSFSGKWEEGGVYSFRLYLFSFIPLGSHTIQLVKADRKQNTIESCESGLLVPVWNHRISFNETKPGMVSYRDEIEIQAKLLTPFVFLFTHIFYRHRQRRWKKLLKGNSTDG